MGEIIDSLDEFFEPEDSKEKESSKSFDKTITTFFKLKDKHGFSKTDIERKLIPALSRLYAFAINPLPRFSAYQKTIKNKKVKHKHFKIDVIEKYVTDVLILMLISKDRESRKEGTSITQSAIEAEKLKLQDKENDYMKNIINGLNR